MADRSLGRFNTNAPSEVRDAAIAEYIDTGTLSHETAQVDVVEVAVVEAAFTQHIERQRLEACRAHHGSIHLLCRRGRHAGAETCRGLWRLVDPASTCPSRGGAHCAERRQQRGALLSPSDFPCPGVLGPKRACWGGGFLQTPSEHCAVRPPERVQVSPAQSTMRSLPRFHHANTENMQQIELSGSYTAVTTLSGEEIRITTTRSPVSGIGQARSRPWRAYQGHNRHRANVESRSDHWRLGGDRCHRIRPG